MRVSALTSREEASALIAEPWAPTFVEVAELGEDQHVRDAVMARESPVCVQPSQQGGVPHEPPRFVVHAPARSLRLARPCRGTASLMRSCRKRHGSTAVSRMQMVRSPDRRLRRELRRSAEVAPSSSQQNGSSREPRYARSWWPRQRNWSPARWHSRPLVPTSAPTERAAARHPRSRLM
jgi:hypothetical protein